MRIVPGLMLQTIERVYYSPNQNYLIDNLSEIATRIWDFLYWLFTGAKVDDVPFFDTCRGILRMKTTHNT